MAGAYFRHSVQYQEALRWRWERVTAIKRALEVRCRSQERWPGLCRMDDSTQDRHDVRWSLLLFR